MTTIEHLCRVNLRMERDNGYLRLGYEEALNRARSLDDRMRALEQAKAEILDKPLRDALAKLADAERLLKEQTQARIETDHKARAAVDKAWGERDAEKARAEKAKAEVERLNKELAGATSYHSHYSESIDAALGQPREGEGSLLDVNLRAIGKMQAELAGLRKSHPIATAAAMKACGTLRADNERLRGIIRKSNSLLDEPKCEPVDAPATAEPGGAGLEAKP